MNEALEAQKILEESYNVAADVWSVTSYKELYQDGQNTERWNMVHPAEIGKIPYISRCLNDAPGVFVAATDYVKALPDSISQWLPRPLVSLGTDGFGRSGSRSALRDFFEVDSKFITIAALYALAREKKIKADLVQKAVKDLDINPNKLNPLVS